MHEGGELGYAVSHAFGAALDVPAQGQGTMNNVTFGNSRFTYYETIGGGQGGRPGRDGMSGVHTGMTNTLDTPVEAIERTYPMRVRRYALRSGSGGAGACSGGDGIGKDYELLADATPLLHQIRGLLAVRDDLAVEIAGHTDDVPVHGGAFASNLELSLARAARVARELAAGDGRLAVRIFAAGYGAQRPVASNEHVEGRARNRRVEIRLVPRDADALG